jgi:hypothetical protein
VALEKVAQDLAVAAANEKAALTTTQADLLADKMRLVRELSLLQI